MSLGNLSCSVLQRYHQNRLGLAEICDDLSSQTSQRRCISTRAHKLSLTRATAPAGTLSSRLHRRRITAQIPGDSMNAVLS